jgi:hypothetical protein
MNECTPEAIWLRMFAPRSPDSGQERPLEFGLRIAPRAHLDVPADGFGSFRRQLSIEIVPELAHYGVTIDHRALRTPKKPIENSHLRGLLIS